MDLNYGSNYQVFVPPGSSPLNLLVPGLVSEMVCDLLLLVGVVRHLLLCLLPWLMLNIMLSLGLGTAVMALIGTINMDTTTNLESAGAMNEVRTLLLIIILNIFLIMAIIHLQAVISVSQDTKEKRAKGYDIAATENVMTMNVTEDQPAVESLMRKDIYIPSDGLGQPVHDSSFDSYDEVP